MKTLRLILDTVGGSLTRNADNWEWTHNVFARQGIDEIGGADEESLARAILYRITAFAYYPPAPLREETKK